MQIRNEKSTIKEKYFDKHLEVEKLLKPTYFLISSLYNVIIFKMTAMH